MKPLTIKLMKYANHSRGMLTLGVLLGLLTTSCGVMVKHDSKHEVHDDYLSYEITAEGYRGEEVLLSECVNLNYREPSRVAVYDQDMRYEFYFNIDTSYDSVFVTLEDDWEVVYDSRFNKSLFENGGETKFSFTGDGDQIYNVYLAGPECF